MIMRNMGKTIRQWFALVLALSLVLGMVPAYAVDPPSEGGAQDDSANAEVLGANSEEGGTTDSNLPDTGEAQDNSANTEVLGTNSEEGETTDSSLPNTGSTETTEEASGAFSLEVTSGENAPLFYFSDFQALLDATNDTTYVPASSTVKITVLESNDKSYSFTPTTYFKNVSSLEIDLHGNVLKINGTTAGNLTLYSSNAKIYDGTYEEGDELTSGIEIENATIYSTRATTTIENIFIKSTEETARTLLDIKNQ